MRKSRSKDKTAVAQAGSDYSWNFSEWESALGISTENLDDEINGAGEIKLSNRLYKTDEEIARFIIREDMKETEKAVHLLKNGAHIQKLSVVNSLKKLAQEYPLEFKNSIVPELLAVVDKDDRDVQIAACKSLYEIVDEDMIPVKMVQSLLSVAKNLIQSSDEAVSEGWSDLLILSLKFMNAEYIEKEILPDVLIDSNLTQPPPYRIWCCRVLGAIANRLPSARMEELFRKKAIEYCQDTDYEVRKCMCNQLHRIAKVVGAETRALVMNEYLELLKDEEQVVRIAGVSNLVNFLKLLDKDSKARIIIPLYKRLCEDRQEKIVEILVNDFGVVLVETKDVLTDADLTHLITFYQFCAVSPNPGLKSSCAYNFPAVVYCVGAAGFEVFKLDKVLESLTMDESEEVRRRLASGFHEVAEILAKRAFHNLKVAFLNLLADEDPEVLAAMVRNVDKVLRTFDISPTQPAHDIFFVILKREREFVTKKEQLYQWRSHYELIAKFECFPDFIDSDFVNEHVVPLLFKLMFENSAKPIKIIAARTLCTYLRKLKLLEQRDKICRQLLELARHRSCHIRLLFLEVCSIIAEIMSRKYFKENFFPMFLELGRDRVPNVRIKACSLIKHFRPALRLPMDSMLLQRLNEMLGDFLTSDRERDVNVLAANVMRHLDAESNMLLDSRSFCVDDDAGDQRKEAEEAKLIEDERDLEDAHWGESPNNSRTFGDHREGSAGPRGRSSRDNSNNGKLGGKPSSAERKAGDKGGAALLKRRKSMNPDGSPTTSGTLLSKPASDTRRTSLGGAVGKLPALNNASSSASSSSSMSSSSGAARRPSPPGAASSAAKAAAGGATNSARKTTTTANSTSSNAHFKKDAEPIPSITKNDRVFSYENDDGDSYGVPTKIHAYTAKSGISQNYIVSPASTSPQHSEYPLSFSATSGGSPSSGGYVNNTSSSGRSSAAQKSSVGGSYHLSAGDAKPAARPPSTLTKSSGVAPASLSTGSAGKPATASGATTLSAAPPRTGVTTATSAAAAKRAPSSSVKK